MMRTDWCAARTASISKNDYDYSVLLKYLNSKLNTGDLRSTTRAGFSCHFLYLLFKFVYA